MPASASDSAPSPNPAPAPAPALCDIDQLFILGDSYSDIGWGYSATTDDLVLPTAQHPMGMINPGEGVFWCRGEFEDNWVVHLSNARKTRGHDLLIYDFAVGGAQVQGLNAQMSQIKRLVRSGGVNLSTNALIVIWIGINDTAINRDPAFTLQMTYLNRYMGELHGLGFRHLVLFDVPPRIYSKTFSAQGEEFRKITRRWNDLLPARIAHWTAKADTSARTFSSFAVFKNILDHPTQHGFTSDDPYLMSGGIWVDGLHATSRVHELLGREVEAFLN